MLFFVHRGWRNVCSVCYFPPLAWSRYFCPQHQPPALVAGVAENAITGTNPYS